MKTVHNLIMIFFCLTFSLADAQNSNVKQTVTNAANDAVQKVVNKALAGKSPLSTADIGTISKSLDNGLTFTVTGCIGDQAGQRVTLYFTITNPSKPNQTIGIGDPYNNNNLTALDENSKSYACASVTLADQTGQGSYYAIGVAKELPSGLVIKGNVVFTNVLPSVSSFAVVNIYEKSSNWDGGGDAKQGFIELRNVPINWNNTNAVVNTTNNDVAAIDAIGGDNLVKNINNGISFAVTGCTGDVASQRVTFYFTLSNPAKVNQQIVVADPINHNIVTAMDAYSKPYNAVKINLADKIGEGYFTTSSGELPTGLSITGSATFTNVLPSLSRFSLVQLYVKSANLDGGGDAASGFIEIRNVPIKWEAKTLKIVKQVKKTAKA